MRPKKIPEIFSSDFSLRQNKSILTLKISDDLIFSHRPLFPQLLNTAHQFRAPLRPSFLICQFLPLFAPLSSFCAPFNNFTQTILPRLRDIYPTFRFFAPLP